MYNLVGRTNVNVATKQPNKLIVLALGLKVECRIYRFQFVPLANPIRIYSFCLLTPILLLRVAAQRLVFPFNPLHFLQLLHGQAPARRLVLVVGIVLLDS